jgi:hypothetical protein
MCRWRRNLKGLAIGYSRSYVAETARYAPEEPQWRNPSFVEAACDRITVIEFPDKATLDKVLELLSRPDVVEAIVPDEERFIDRAMTELAICEAESTSISA